MFYIYVLWSKKLKKRYVGSTEDVNRRLSQHNRGKNRFTKGGLPWIVIHTEKFPTLSLARERELFLKSGIGRAWLDSQFPKYK
jgi:putative endonuclease